VKSPPARLSAAKRPATGRMGFRRICLSLVPPHIEAAYRRSDLFEKRRVLMQQWATFCGQASGDNGAKVIPLRA
jgi:hypothetical protein